MIYTSKEQLVIEFKKLLLDNQISQRDIAKELNITPQSLTKTLNKHNLGFDDINKLLKPMGYSMEIQFTKN